MTSAIVITGVMFGAGFLTGVGWVWIRVARWLS